MPLMRGAVVLMMLTATSCVFHHQNVTCDVADAICGQNESCASADNGVVCSCGTQQSVSAVCTGGTVCAPDTGACVTNNPPTAVIRSAKADGTLRVPANGTVTLSGADSSDPEGGTLTYAWSFSSACGVSGVDLTQATVTIDSSSITDGCVVTLTVTDPLGASTSAQATLVPRLVGGFVSSTSPCVVAYQADSEGAQGTFDNPFCAPAQAMLAAADNALGQVSLASEVFNINATLDLGTTPVQGGFDVDRTAPWVSGSGTTRLMGSAGLHSQDVVRMTAPGTSQLANVTIGRSVDCGTSCNILEISGTNATLAEVVIKTNEGAVAASPITGVMNSVYAHAGASSAASTSVTLSGCTIEGLAATVTHAVRLDGPLDALVVDSTIVGGGGSLLSVGIRTTKVRSFTMDGVAINALGPGITNGVAVGYLDGTNGQIYGRCADGSETDSCDGSTTVTLQNSQISITGYPTTAIGVGAAKTDDIVLDEVTVDVTSGVAVGVRSLDSGHVRVVDSNITATGVPGIDVDARYAAGLFDGASVPLGSGDATNGSNQVDVSGGNIQGLVVADLAVNISSVSGLLLYSTQGGTIQNAQFSASCSQVGKAEIATAVTTWKTANMQFVHADMNVSNLIATTRVSAFTDGRTQGTLGAVASTNLGFSGGTFSADFSDNTVAVERAVMIFAGTDHANVDSATLSFTPGWAASATTMHEIGVWSAATDTLTLKNITVNHADASTSPSTGTTWFYGFLDGPTEGDDIDADLTNAASTSLVLDRNRIRFTGFAPANVLGITVRGESLQTSVGGGILPQLITNNFVDVDSGGQSFGIVVDRALAAVEMNTVRYGLCETTSCAGYGAGIYLQHTSDRQATIIGNVFTVGQRSLQDNSPIVLDAEGDSSIEFGWLHFDDNGRGGSGASPPIVSAQWAIANTARTVFVNIPTQASTVSEANEKTRLSTAGSSSTITNNGDGTVAFCDEVHVSSAPVGGGFSSSAAAFIGAEQLDTDIDDNVRPNTYDSGANVRSFCH